MYTKRPDAGQKLATACASLSTAVCTGVSVGGPLPIWPRRRGENPYGAHPAVEPARDERVEAEAVRVEVARRLVRARDLHRGVLIEAEPREVARHLDLASVELRVLRVEGDDDVVDQRQVEAGVPVARACVLVVVRWVADAVGQVDRRDDGCWVDYVKGRRAAL